MLLDDKRAALRPVLLGVLLGVAAHLLLGYCLGSFSLFGPSHFTGFQFPTCNFPLELESLGVLLSFALFALFGAEAAIATLPFADGGRLLALRSAAHFGAMAGTLWVWVILNFPREPLPSLALTFLVPFTLVYLLVWLGRWVGWAAEAAEIREKLGLSAAPSPLKWRETLPHIGFAALLCLVLPLVLRLCDAADVPVLSGLLYPYLLLPIGGFGSAFSLGRRQGACPLYPLACMGFVLLFIPLARLCSNMDDWPLLWIALGFTLAGNVLGAAVRWYRKRRMLA